MEIITCSAIWYKDLPTQIFLPDNIKSGIVVAGHRHAHCIETVKILSELRSVRFGPSSVGETIQGFLTNKNRFVDRLEAMEIAINSEQVDKNLLDNPRIGLFSEDLY
jgi:hypothetical protein